MDDSDTGIYARRIDGIDRAIRVGVASGRAINVSMPDAPSEGADPDHELLDRIERFLGGEADDFGDVPTALTVPTDQRAVLERVQEIPYGGTTDVATLARTTPGLDEEDVGTVRDALRANPVPILIPGHRVVDGPSPLPGELDRRLRRVESDG